MKKVYIMVLAAALLTGVQAAGCSGEPKVYTDPEEPVTVQPSREFIIATASNPPTGYQWRATYDENTLKLVSSTFESSRAVQNGEEKVLLQQHFRFQALRKGQTTVRLELKGPDLEHIWQQKVFSVTIR